MKVAFGIPLFPSDYYMSTMRKNIFNEDGVNNYLRLTNLSDFTWKSSRSNFLDLEIKEPVISPESSLKEIMEYNSKSKNILFTKNTRDIFGYRVNDDNFSRLIFDEDNNTVYLEDSCDDEIYPLGRLNNAVKFTIPLKYFASYIINNNKCLIEDALIVEGRNSGIIGSVLWIYILCRDIPEELIYKFLALTKNRGEILITENVNDTILFSVCSNTLIFTPDLKSKSRTDFMGACVDADDHLEKQITKAYPTKDSARNRFSTPYILLKRRLRAAETETNYLETIGYICTGLVSYISNGSRTPAHISRIVISDSFKDTSMKVFDSIKNQLSFDVHYMIANGLAKSVKKYHKSTKCPFYGGDRNFIEKSVLGPEFRFAIHNHEFFSSYAGIFSNDVRL